jgi:uncharacterized protein YpmS
MTFYVLENGIYFTAEYRIYADDIQLFVVTTPSEFENALCKLEKCIVAVDEWSEVNSLYLNILKCEFLILGSPRVIQTCHGQNIKFGDIFLEMKSFA